MEQAYIVMSPTLLDVVEGALLVRAEGRQLASACSGCGGQTPGLYEVGLDDAFGDECIDV